MGWSIGYDSRWQRDIGYDVPAFCDHPGCGAEIDRGLSYVCCGQEPGGCGLYFCGKHARFDGKCERCAAGAESPFDATPDHPEWIQHKLTDPSWADWRAVTAAILVAWGARRPNGELMLVAEPARNAALRSAIWGGPCVPGVHYRELRECGDSRPLNPAERRSWRYLYRRGYRIVRVTLAERAP